MKNKKNFIVLFVLITFLSLALSRERVGLGFSSGDIYFSRLQQWYSFAKNNDWAQADALEKGLDPADTFSYKSTHRPEELKKYINTIIVKQDKTVEDWLEIARVQSLLGKSNDAYTSISTARSLDPIRDDVGQLFYQSNK